MKLLLGRGAEVRSGDKDGHTDVPLHNAASAGHTEIVELLLEHGACIDSWNREGPSAALCNASRGGHFETVKLLLAKRAFIYPSSQTGVGCALCAAAENGHTSILEILISSDSNGIHYLSPAIILAARSGQAATVDYLLGKAADIDASDEWDLPGAPLREAVANGHAETVNLLLERKVDFRAADVYGPESALRIAAVAGEQEIVALLLRKYETGELAVIQSTATQPELKAVVLREYKKRLGKVVRDVARSEPDLEI